MPDTRPRTRRETTNPVSWSSDLVIVAAATVCATVLWLSADLLGGVDLAVRQGDLVRQVGGVSVVLTSAAAAALGLLALRLLERLVPGALVVWTALAVTVALVSMLGPLGATTAAATGTLVALHALVATVVVTAAHRSRRAFART